MSSIKSEAEKCLQCKVAQCSKACPVGTPIPQIMSLFLEGKIKDAGKILFENNPLSAITSVICPHERNCTGHCVLGRKNTPVEFYKIEQYISHYYLETMKVPQVEKNGIRVAVAGGGPAGLTMTIILARLGYEVTLFEALSDIGGVLRYGIPPFRLSREILEYYKKLIDDLGVRFRPNTSIGTNINISDLFLDGYKAVFLAVGTGRPNRLGLLGETLGNVHYAIDYLKAPEKYHLGRNVAVIGAGNVAIDAARSALRYGAQSVRILHFMGDEEMTANRSEIEMAELEGVEFIHFAQAVRILDNSVRCVRVKKNVSEDGGVTFEEDYSETFDVESDSVIIAIGQGPGSDFSYGKMEQTKKGLIKVNDFGETGTPGVFAAGDVVSGQKTVIEAVSFTKTVAEKMIRYLEDNKDK